MRNLLDWIYRISGVISVVLLILIAVLTVAQMLARLAGSNVPSADDFATFCMAGSIFLGLAYTYRVGGHVRVLSLRQWLASAPRRWLEAACLGAAAATLGWLLWYTQDMIRSSYQLNERTIGLIPVAMWVPMTSMLIGLLVMFLAVVDDLVIVLSNGRPSYAAEEEKEGLPSVTAE